MSAWPSLPLFLRVEGRAVILLGRGEAAEAKRRLLERAGAVVVEDDSEARLAFVAVEDEAEAAAAAARLRARGLLVNVVDRPALCDFTVPAIVDRAPVLVAVGTGGVSAGLAAALRQRLEALLPATLGRLAERLHAARDELRARFPDAGERRRALGAALARVDLLAETEALSVELAASSRLERIVLRSADPDDLTLREARQLAQADRLYHAPDIPVSVLDRARADAARIVCATPPDAPPAGLSIWLEMA